MKSKWPMVPLGDVLTQYREYIESPEPKIYPKLSVKLYGKGVILDSPTDGIALKMKRHQIAKSGQVILSEIWGKKGAIGFVPPEGEGALCTSHFFLFDIDSCRIEQKYLQAIFTANYLQDQLDAEAKGTTGYAAVRPKILFCAKIPLPPLDEQRSILARIEELAARIEEARELRRRAVEEAEALIALMLSKIFDYIPLDALPAGWIWKPLNSILINKKYGLTTGPFGTLLQKSEIQLDGIPILGISNVESNRFVPGFRDYITPEKADFLSSYRLKAGDIVIARSGTVGRSCTIPEGLAPSPIMSTNLLRMRLNTNEFSPKLFCMLLNSSALIKTLKDKECRGSTREFFTQKILFKLMLPVPPLEEQCSIVAYLDGMQTKLDALKRHQAETAAELDALLPAVLERAFRGEL